MSSRPELSIVVGTRNRPEGFRALVDSIEAHTPMSWELVVSDASDIPIDEQEVATDVTWPKIRIIPERPRLGHVKGYNVAFKACRGKWVLWLNDDVEVMSGYAENAIRFMEDNPHIGMGAIYYDERPHQDFHINYAWGMPYANFGILRRSFGNKLGWFDEDFEMYGADNAFTFQVLLAGMGIAGIPNSRVHHNVVNDPARQENQTQAAHFRATDILEAKYRRKLPELLQLYEQTSKGVTA